MKFQVALASTISTTVGLSALAVDAKEEMDFPQQQIAQRKIDLVDRDRKLKNIAQINGAIETVLHPISDSAVSSNEFSGKWASSDKEDSKTLDLGILGSNANTHHQPDYRQLQVDKYKFSDDLYQDAYEAIYYAPLIAQAEATCTIIDFIGANCNSCGIYDISDPISGNHTGVYNVEINCPSARGYGIGLDSLMDTWSKFCIPDYFCPGCDPVCASCSIDTDIYDLSIQDCFLTDELRVGITNARNDGYPMYSAAPSITSTGILTTLALAGVSVVSMAM